MLFLLLLCLDFFSVVVVFLGFFSFFSCWLMIYSLYTLEVLYHFVSQGYLFIVFSFFVIFMGCTSSFDIFFFGFWFTSVFFFFFLSVCLWCAHFSCKIHRIEWDMPSFLKYLHVIGSLSYFTKVISFPTFVFHGISLSSFLQSCFRYISAQNIHSLTLYWLQLSLSMLSTCSYSEQAFFSLWSFIHPDRFFYHHTYTHLVYLCDFNFFSAV